MTIDTQSQTSLPASGVRPPEFASAVLDSLDVAVLVVDRNGTICYRNTTGASWLPDDPNLSSVLKEARFLEPFEGWSTELPRVIDEGQALRFEAALRLSAGSSPVLVTVRCTPLRERGSQPITGAVILIEQGQRQEAVEERLEVSKRLASLGKLATRVAHELNNPLDGILRYINLAMRVASDAPDSKVKDYLAESRIGLIRMVQIISELLEFSRTTDGEFDEMNINEVIEQAIKSTASTADANGVVVAADFHNQDMPAIRGSRLYQVCCNLIKNAVDAMPDGGRLSITTGLVDDQVIIQVSDTGVGLPEPIEQIFEPFFTTKEAGKGTGLGLAICKDFIEDMQGTITAEPADDGGAVFTVRIPTEECHRPSPLTASTADTKVGDPARPPR